LVKWVGGDGRCLGELRGRLGEIRGGGGITRKEKWGGCMGGGGEKGSWGGGRGNIVGMGGRLTGDGRTELWGEGRGGGGGAGKWERVEARDVAKRP